MDKKKTLTLLALVMLWLGGAMPVDIQAQTPSRLDFRDRSYGYGIGNDSIKVFFNLMDADGKRMPGISPEMFDQMAYFYEDGTQIEKWQVRPLASGVRIPKEYTFSILLDRTIPTDGKKQILNSVRQFVGMAPDSCVYISFYGDEVSGTRIATTTNLQEIEKSYLEPSEGKSFYSGIHSKLAEFSTALPSFASDIRATDYKPNPEISRRSALNPGKNYLMVFSEGSRRPDDEELDFLTLMDYQAENASVLPKVYAFYYTADGDDPMILDTLEGLTHPQDSTRKVIDRLKGQVAASANMEEVVSRFNTIIEDATYDYELSYSATPGKVYAGNVAYQTKWGKNDIIGNGTLTVGSAERPWPEREQTTTGILVELLVALLVTLLTILFFYLVMKIGVPFVQSLAFKSKYYVKYKPEEKVTRRICHYCKKDLEPGQTIVTKCNHWMHKHCWQQNEYKCAELGQNCKTGVEKHVEWKELLKPTSFKDCMQTIMGIVAGLVSWLIYEMCGRGGFSVVSEFIVGMVLKPDGPQASLIPDCVARTSSFLMMGLLLGFFISIVFRYRDDVRDMTWKIWLKIIGLSLLTALVGMLAFAVGADLLCLILTWTGKNFIPWYCSLPAYILFSISVSLMLTIESSIPVKSALLGGVASAMIGFLVLYFTKFTSGNYEWLNMLLYFIIYGGGLGASLVTVRMLAEKYFLVIANGVKEGQRIPIHKWMNATGGGNQVAIGMVGECEIQMNWEKSNKVAKKHALLYIDHEKSLPVIKPLATGVLYNSRADLPVNRPAVLSNGDTFKIGDTIFRYEEA